MSTLFALADWLYSLNPYQWTALVVSLGGSMVIVGLAVAANYFDRNLPEANGEERDRKEDSQ